MNFEESVNYLYSLGNEVLAMKLGLESSKMLLEELGNPQNEFLKIQVAGTNGKGSVCAFLDAILRAAGIESGLYTSPHLISITERVRIGGAEIGEDKFADHATRVRYISERLVAEGKLESVPTFFEQMTAIALSAFAGEKIRIAVLETGLGGRFDATTAARAEIAAITPIDYDHQRILGNTLAEIAAEKAAIIRSDTKVFVLPQHNEAENVIREKCRETGVDAVWVKPDVKVIEDLGGDLKRLAFRTNKTSYKPDFRMRGRHQWTNASLAIAVAEHLQKTGFEITRDAITHGLETAEHKGRLEFFEGVLFDGAHNIAGARALREYLDESVDRPVTMIFGAMKDKDLTEIACILFPKAENLILTVPDNPRSMPAEELLKFVPEEFDKNKVHTTATIEDALDKAFEIAPKDHLICVTGSLYLVGEAQKILKQRSEI